MLRNRGLEKKWRANFSLMQQPGKSMTVLTVALFFAFVAIASIFTSRTLVQAATNSIAPSTPTPEIIAQPPIPLVVLHQTEGNFFVLASDIPFEIGQGKPEVSWLAVEPLNGLQTAPRIVPIASKADNLPPGTYFSAIRVSLTTSTGADYLLIPVALTVGAEVNGGFSQNRALQKLAPENTMRLYVQDSNIDVRFTMTPGGHYIIEVIDKIKANQKREKLRQNLKRDPEEVLRLSAVSENYEIVFPWMCLEHPCGRSTEDDIADVEPHLDAVNAVSYERYNMSDGDWSNYEDSYNIGNPGPWANSAGLGTWPMVTGSTSQASVQGMWNNRANIASEMIAAADAGGYQGYCIDVEGYADTTTKNTFISLMDYLADELHASGYQLMVAHATWSTIAPIGDLAMTSVDYVVTMDPYTSWWDQYIPVDYGAIDHNRLAWGFTWDAVSTDTQLFMWQWMVANGYNAGVAGAAAWRTPLDGSQDYNPGNDVDYYQGFRDYYPIATAGCTTTVPSNRWQGEYFNNTDLSGSPVMVRDDGTGFLDFDWAYGGPGGDCGIGSDYFSARWSRDVSLAAGTYRFTITSDDGFRLYVDGALKLSKWIIQGPTTYVVDVPLSAGIHVIRLEYYENNGYATAQLSWQPVAQSGCIASVPADRWQGEYFNNTDLSGSPVMVRDDGAGFLDFDWANGGPGGACGIGSDYFSARWSRNVSFAAGTYRFTITSDDGFRLYVDGVVRLSRWIIQSPTTYTVDVPLSAGIHAIRLEYYENNGYATAQLSWQPVAQGNCSASVPADHWQGEYFNNTDLSGSPAMVRDDGAGFLDFDWAYGGPGGACGIGSDYFSARWSRDVSFAAGAYRFTVTSDDGFRLYVDGVVRLSRWIIQGPTTYTVDVALTAGIHVIKLEYYENNGYATAQLSWQQLDKNNCTVIVPANHWQGEYFNNTDLSGSPVMVRDDGTGFLSFDWANGGPGGDCGIGSDYFSARWSRDVSFAAGTYRFTITSDDGFRLYVDGAVKLSKWIIQGPTTYTVDVALSAGIHVLKLEYFENNGYATAQLSWAAVSSSSSWAYPVGDANTANGWVVTNPLGNSWYSSEQQKWYRGHLGEDWFKSGESSLGEPVFAAAAGEVMTVLQNCGNYVDVVIIAHQVDGFSEPIYSFYGHIEADGYVEEGDWVAKRQQIGLLGDPGTFEPHLHFEIKNHTALINPPFSSCSDTANGIYISAGYSGKSDDYDGGDYYDPTDDIAGNRYYHPTKFIESRNGGGPPPGADCSSFVSDLNYPDGSVVAAGQTINKGWRLSNCGTTTWSATAGYRAVRIDGSYGPSSFDIPTVAAGQNGDLYVDITVPSTPGTHRATYKLEGSAGTFGDPFWVEIVVQGTSPTVIIDDGDAGFVLFGPPAYWHQESIGYGGDMYWTYVNGNIVSNKVQWRPQLAGAGNYQVQAFIPHNYATTTSAKYTIVANGTSHTATVNQNIYYDEWVTLGTYYFNSANNGSEYVELTDATGEPGSTYLQIGFDAVRWEKQ